MCGVLATINLAIDNSNLESIAHRGPDSKGIYSDNTHVNSVCLGQTRLSIVDLSDAGYQPMISDCGNYVISFNGEIYNHNELRNELKDIMFKGHSDTETILYYIARYGIESISKFNGIFAFVFYDKHKQQVYVARDHFGIKPMYYYSESDKMIFSSELRGIKSIIPKFELNYECLHTYLRLRFCPAPLTLFKEVSKLEAGYYLTVDLTKKPEVQKHFYSYIPDKNLIINENDALDIYDDLLHKAVKRQLMADVPIAIMLSGGVDSALLTYLAKKVSGTDFESYTIGYDVKSLTNEFEDARYTSKLIGTRHHEITLKAGDFMTDQKFAMQHVEEPIGSQSIYPFQKLCENIHAENYKVAFSGQGIDEAWAGYGRYNFQNLFGKISSPVFDYDIFKIFFKNDKLRRGLNSLSEPNKLERYIESYSFFDKNMTKQLTSKFNQSDDKFLSNFFLQKSNLLNLGDKSSVDTMMILDTRLALSDDLLLYTDKLSMQHSLEVRVPFLDVELMQFVESLPDKYKVNAFQNKILHKKLAERYLPKEIIYRKKKGFYIPRKEILQNKAGDEFKQMLEKDNTLFSEIFNKKYIYELIEKHQKAKYNYEDQLYSLINLFFWFSINSDILI